MSTDTKTLADKLKAAPSVSDATGKSVVLTDTNGTIVKTIIANLVPLIFTAKRLNAKINLNDVSPGVYYASGSSDNPQNSYGYNTIYLSFDIPYRLDRFQIAMSGNSAKIAFRRGFSLKDSPDNWTVWKELAFIS